MPLPETQVKSVSDRRRQKEVGGEEKMAAAEKLTNPYYRSLNRNIILTIIGVSLIPLVVVSVTIYSQFSTSYRQKVYDHLGELVHKHKQNIDGFLSERLSGIRLMAANFSVETLSQESFLRERLAALQMNYGAVFVDLGLVNETGEQIAYAGPFKLAKANYAEAEWFRQAMARQQYISDVFLGLRNLPHFIVAVQNETNGVRWILRATIDFVAFSALVESISLGQTGFAFILNSEGELQTTPIKRPPAEIFLEEPIYKELLRDQLNDSSDIRVTVRPDRSNRRYIYVSSFLKNGEWLLVYQQSAADALTELNRTFFITTVMMVVASIAVVLTALALSKKIVAKIALADEEKQMMNQKVVETGKLASVGELAAGVAHEINNPVAIMVEEAGWMGDLLEEEEFRDSRNLEELKRAISQIQNQGKRCKEITHKLLSFARKTDGTLQEVDINELLDEMVALEGQRAKYGMVQIQKNYQEDLPPLKLSVSEMQQVVFNLIHNAIDAMEDGGGVLTLSTRRENGYVVVDVADTGKGIPEANLARIFDPFFTTKPVGKGTGLGLSICFGLIDKMGGKIQCQSAVGRGTTFSVHIPEPTAAAERQGGNP